MYVKREGNADHNSGRAVARGEKKFMAISAAIKGAPAHGATENKIARAKAKRTAITITISKEMEAGREDLWRIILLGKLKSVLAQLVVWVARNKIVTRSGRAKKWVLLSLLGGRDAVREKSAPAENAR